MWDIHGLCKVRNAAVLGMSHWRGCSGSAHAHSSEPRYLSPSCPFDTPGVCHPRVSRLHLLIRLPPQLPHTLKINRAPKTYPSPEAPSGSADVKTSPCTTSSCHLFSISRLYWTVPLVLDTRRFPLSYVSLL